MDRRQPKALEKYRDAVLSVHTGVDVSQELPGYHRPLNNAIEMKVSGLTDLEKVHFIQFVTRQIPDAASGSEFDIWDWDAKELYFALLL